MKFFLYLYRKAKSLYVRLGLHVLTEPFSSLIEDLFYLSKFSKWRKTIVAPAFNDFYNGSVDYWNRNKLYQHVFEAEQLQGEINYLEFGVAGGESFGWWMRHNQDPKSQFVGFDTFTGLPEDWSGTYKKGAMSNKGNLPELVDQRGSFQAGLFQETLPGFIRSFCFDKRMVVHLDADLYSSTLFVLTSLAPHLKKGDILLFDEFFAPPHEFRAFMDFVNSFYLKYEVVGAVNNYMQIAVKVVQ